MADEAGDHLTAVWGQFNRVRAWLELGDIESSGRVFTDDRAADLYPLLLPYERLNVVLGEALVYIRSVDDGEVLSLAPTAIEIGTQLDMKALLERYASAGLDVPMRRCAATHD